MSIVLITHLMGCKPAQIEGNIHSLEDFGLVEAPQDRPLVSAALHLTEALTGDGMHPRLVAGWQAFTPAANEWRVFAATQEGGGQDEIVNTYGECQCVVVRVGTLASWSMLHMGTNSALISYDREAFLAYMLLHEAGHIINDGRFGENAATVRVSSSFNRDPTLQKEREVAADTYAAETVKEALKQKGSERGLAASNVAMSLSELSWNLQVHRSLDSFGATITKAPAVFWDSGLSHPNLEWRILRANALIQGTEASAGLLRSFEESRGDKQKPLFLDRTL